MALFGGSSKKQLLRFQDKSLHLDIRLGALKLYRRHLADQYSDRCAFWALKDISGEQMARTMTIMTDGADQDCCLACPKKT